MIKSSLRHDPAAGPSRPGTDTGTAAPPGGRAPAPPHPGPWRARVSGWAPAAAVGAFVLAVLGRYGVSAADVALFAAYVALGLTLPGLLLLRALYGGSRTAAEEVALGTTLGYAVEVLAYVAARAAGAPLLVLAWPVAVYAVFLAVPRLRRHWRGTHRPRRSPLWYSWSLALVVAFLVAWSALAVFGRQGLAWPALGVSTVDMPFHLALVGELRNHVPPSVPWIDGEPLLYHWFVYAHLAAASWVTGVEPEVLLLRLGMLPMLAAFVVLVGMTGRRVTNSWPAASAAVLCAVLVAAPNLYLGANPNFTWGGIQETAWLSPTQTFGALLFAPVVVILLDLFERRSHGAGTWVLLGVLLVAVMGAKATYLPMLAAGLLAVTVLEALKWGRPHRSSLVALGMTAACLLFAQFVLFGHVRQGTVVQPLDLMRLTWAELTGRDQAAEPPTASLLGLTLVYLSCWAVAWGGALGLLSRLRLLVRPAVVLMLGIGAAGLGAALLLAHPGLSQLYFLRGAYPYPVIVAVYGLLVVLRRARVSHRATLLAAGAGAAVAQLIPFACGVRVPLAPGQGDTALYRPYLVLAVVAVVVYAVLVRAGRRSGDDPAGDPIGGGRLRARALVLVMLAAVGLPAAAHARVLSLVHGGSLAYQGGGEAAQGGGADLVPAGALDAGRWLRDHSDPDDLIATNVHCRWGHESPCDSSQFWASALTERHVLVEGWAYTSTNMDRWRPGELPQHRPFWDGERMRANEAVFDAPSVASAGLLRDRYGVRWLLADERRLRPGTRIGEVADLRFRSGDYAVYRLPEGA
ncbi:hypothetical protein [Streptosporangium sp. NPDC051022]|uniref:hypothetical protein n=1 Tax=Streptosporangium sp. NPDC051022 TaxID=3155752 RepID=UPI00342C9766